MTGSISSLLYFDLDVPTYPEGILNFEFSEDGKKFYVIAGGDLTYNNDLDEEENSKLIRNSLWQYDLSIMEADAINNSKKLIKKNSEWRDYDTPRYGDMRYLELAPNGKIYIARNTKGGRGPTFVEFSAITKPNLSGDSCGFELFGSNGLLFTGSNDEFINMPRGQFSFDVKINATTTCEGEELIVTADALPDITANKYIWILPDGSTMTGKTIRIPNAKVNNSGMYYVKVDINSVIREDSSFVRVYPKPKAEISGNLSFCKEGTTVLNANSGESYKYKWSNGSTSQSITVNRAGQYWVMVENGFGCQSYDTVTVENINDIAFEFTTSDKLCLGDTLLLATNLEGSDFTFEWSTGEITPDILITKGGKYILRVVSKSGCEGIDSIFINEYEKSEVSFAQQIYTICEGESLTIKPLKILANTEYLWSDGIEGAERTFTESAELILIAISENGCLDSAQVTINALEMPKSVILASEIEVCAGETITLTAEDFNPKYQYNWSNGEIGESISVNKSGTYQLIVSNSNYCSDTSEVNVIVHPALDLQILADNTNLCFGEETRLYTEKEYSTYLWSSGETSESISVSKAGTYKLWATNSFGCIDSAEIIITKYDAALSVDTDNFEFDDLCIGESQSKIINITLSSGEMFNISEITTKSDSYEIQYDNQVLTNGETIEVIVNFQPTEAGYYDDELVIKSVDPCDYELIIPIKASAKQIIRYTLGEIQAEPGDYIKIPINAEIVCPAPQNIHLDYELEITIDKNYFLPDSVGYGKILSNETIGNNRVIRISSDAIFMQHRTEINALYGTALIGGDDIAPIEIVDATFSKERYFYEVEEGSLQVEGCVNEISGLQMFVPTGMTITPNPSDRGVKVQLKSQEEGTFKLSIYDIQGRKVAENGFVKTNRNFEIREFYFDTIELGNGTYTLHLEAPWTYLKEQIVIMR